MNAANNNKVLIHYGVPGMKWGVRRYQNYDGTLIGSRPRTGKEKRQARKVANAKRGDPTTEAVNRLLKKSDSKVAKKLVSDYESRKAENIKKAEAKQDKVKAEADKKYAEKVAKSNPIYYKSKTMTDEQLKQQIQRLNLEEQWRQAATRDIYNGEHYVKYNKSYDQKDFFEKLGDETERNVRQELGREFSKELLKKMALAAATAA